MTEPNKEKEIKDPERMAYVSAVVYDGLAKGEDEILKLYKGVQKETYKDVDICNDLSHKQMIS